MHLAETVGGTRVSRSQWNVWPLIQITAQVRYAALCVCRITTDAARQRSLLILTSHMTS